MNRQLALVFKLFALILVPAWDLAAIPLGPGISYQGTIEENGVPVEGAITLLFTLWDDFENGNPIGFSQKIAEAPVVDGNFTVTVNAAGEFGPNAFTGDARWLQIETCADAECASTTVLLPRQPITAAPYALHASGPWKTGQSGATYTNGKVGIGSATPHHQLRISGGPIWTSNEWTGALELDNGAAIGWRENTGEKRFGMGHWEAGLNFFTTDSDPGDASSEAQYLMIITDNGFVGIGDRIPDTKLQVNDGRIRLRESATLERWDLFYDPPSEKFYLQENASFNHLVFTKGPDSRVGLGTDNPSAKLDVRSTDTTPALRVEASDSSGTALEIGTGGIRIPGAGANTATPVFIHIADSANSRFCDNTGCFCYQTVIDHPMTNNDPSAILFATVNGLSGSGHPQINRIYYDETVNMWVIACTFNEYFCAGQKFNILVFKP